MKNIRELPTGWVVVKLEDVCEIFDNKRIPINANEREKRIIGKNFNDLYPYYGATGQVGYIDDYLLEGEYILLGEDGAPFLESFKAKAYIVSGKVWVNNHAHILKAHILNKFVSHYLNQFDYRGFVTGTTRLKLNQSSMKDIPIKMPPLPEQRRIVEKIEELFSELDNGIESLKAAQQQLKVYRQAVLKWAFEKNLESKTETSIRAVSSFVTSGSRGWAQYYSDEGAKFIRIGNLTRDGIELDLSEIQYVNLPEKAEGLRSRLQVGDLLISITADLGSIAIVPSNLGEAYINQHIAVVRLNDTRYSKFIACFFKSEIGRNRLLAYQRGATKKGLGLDDIRDVVVPFPEINEALRVVQEIESHFSDCDKMEEAIEQSLKQAEALRQSILKKAFEGKLILHDPNDEPAEKLLERIRAEKETQETESETTKRRTKK